MRSPLPFPCVPDRPYKILLVQVGTLSFSHPSFGVPVLFIYLFTAGSTFGEWLDELPFEVAAATARLLKHHARSGAWVELSPGNPSQASRAGRDRDRSSPNCPSDMSELSENSD